MREAFRKAALETFLNMAACQYKSFNLTTLSEMFEMDLNRLKRVISQLIMVNRLQMSLDNEHNLLIVDRSASDIKEI